MDKDFTILYVDDESHNLNAFKAAFRREYKVYTALGGQEALELMKEKPINLIITDQAMPEMTGVELLEKILPLYPDTFRIILTGFSDINAVINAINKGHVFRYITKPWDKNELMMTIENVRTLHKLQRKNHDLVEQLQQKIQEQERVLKLFRKYVPEPVVEQALEQSEGSVLEGEERHIAVLFCDIRGFTSVSEALEPKLVVRLLNTYYSTMAEYIRKHNGFVNQYVGDEIFATFGAPIDSQQNETNAVACACDMLGAIHDFNADCADLLPQNLEVGIGVNAGMVVAGNLGSEDRIDYSVTGDTVNTGKRIEALTQDYPGHAFVGESVYEVVKDRFILEKMPDFQVKGKSQPLQVYDLKGRKS